MEDRIEALDQARHRTMWGFLVAFVAWQLPALAQQAFDGALSSTAGSVLASVAVVGSLVFIVYAARLWWLNRTIAREEETVAALNDERVRQARRRAFVFAYWSLLVYLAAARFSLFVIELDAAVVAQLGLVVAASAAIAAFLYHDRG